MVLPYGPAPGGIVTIDEDCVDVGYTLGDVSFPPFEYRKEHYDDSKWVPGKRMKSAVLDQAEFNFLVIARAASDALLHNAVDVLEAALGQWSYDVTHNLDGETWTYDAEINRPAWGQIVIGHRKLHVRVGRVSIPVNPPE